MKQTFGAFLRRLRVERQMSVRGFSHAAGMDPANCSKLERGLLPPPRDEERLAAFTNALGLGADSAESRELRRLAALDRGEVPQAILGDRRLFDKLPALFRTLEGDGVDDEVLDDLIATLRGGA
jgi:transcriptional regulator with XRE-family HTH domain